MPTSLMLPPQPIPGQHWQLDATAREIVHAGRRIRLAEKPFRVLQALIEAGGQVVTRAALRRRLWPDETFVDFDNNLNTAVASLRQTLATLDPGAKPIETIPKVGYRLNILVGAPGRLPDRHAAEESNRSAARAGGVALWLMVGAAIAAGVGGALMATWLGAHRGDSPSDLPAHPAARDFFERGIYLRGRYHSAPGGDPSQLTAAREAFAEAFRVDSGFADAAAEEADALVEMSFAGAIAVRDGLTQARARARQALALDPRQSSAARATGLAALVLDWDFAGARLWLDRAAAAADARTSLAHAAWLAAAGQADAAVTAAERAVALDPAAHYVRADLAMFYLAAGRDAEAAESSRRVLEVAPSFAPARSYAVIAHERLARWLEAARHARVQWQAIGASPQDLALFDRADARTALGLWRRADLAWFEGRVGHRRDEFALLLARRQAAAGNRQEAIAALDVALTRRDPLLVFIRLYPELAALHRDAAFERIARSIRPAPDGGA